MQSFLAVRSVFVCSGALSLVLLAGCHRSAPQAPAPAAKSAPQHTTQQAAPKNGKSSDSVSSAMQRLADQIKQNAQEEIAKDYALLGIPDDRLVKFNAQGGVGIGLKIKDRTVRVGQPIRIHVAYQNIGATDPLSTDLCPGLGVAYVNLDTGQFGFGQDYIGMDCDKDSGNAPTMVPGKVYIVDFPMIHIPKDPGRYAISVSWQPLKARHNPLNKGSMSSALSSNMVEVDIMP